MTGICKLCQEEHKLCRSHIIPEFFYDKVYDIKPKRFWFIKIDSRKSFRKQEQKGLREYLLCNKCEAEFSAYEKYAAEIIYGKNKKSPAVLISKSANDKISVNEFTGIDYTKFKLFLISILWRISISNEKFNAIEISEFHINKLHKALKEKQPLEENEYRCTLHIVYNSDNAKFGGSIIGPYETNYHGNQVVNLLADGHLFSFIMGNPVLDPEIEKTMLNKKGGMAVLTKKVQDDNNLMEAAKLVNEKYGQ